LSSTGAATPRNSLRHLHLRLHFKDDFRSGTGFASLPRRAPGLCPINSNTRSNQYSQREDSIMLYWALMFLVIALVAALFGFGGIAVEAAAIGKILFVVFLILFLVSLLTGAIRRPAV